jgi:phage gp36-like protein
VYCDKGDLVARFGEEELRQLTDEASGAAISDADVSAACDEASSQIDLYLGRRYAVPLTTIPSIVKQWACALARLTLWGNRAGEGTTVRVNADDAMAVIRDVATGKASLPGQSATTTAAVVAAAVTERTSAFPDTLFADQMVRLP